MQQSSHVLERVLPQAIPLLQWLREHADDRPSVQEGMTQAADAPDALGALLTTTLVSPIQHQDPEPSHLGAKRIPLRELYDTQAQLVTTVIRRILLRARVQPFHHVPESSVPPPATTTAAPDTRKTRLHGAATKPARKSAQPVGGVKRRTWGPLNGASESVLCDGYNLPHDASQPVNTWPNPIMPLLLAEPWCRLRRIVCGPPLVHPWYKRRFITLPVAGPSPSTPTPRQGEGVSGGQQGVKHVAPNSGRGCVPKPRQQQKLRRRRRRRRKRPRQSAGADGGATSRKRGADTPVALEAPPRVAKVRLLHNTLWTPKPGLPQSHPLCVLDPSKANARRLLSHILYDTCIAPVAANQHKTALASLRTAVAATVSAVAATAMCGVYMPLQATAVSSTSCPSTGGLDDTEAEKHCTWLPHRLLVSIPFFEMMLHRHQTCKYGWLLEHHCALPAVLRTSQLARQRERLVASAPTQASSFASPSSAHPREAGNNKEAQGVEEGNDDDDNDPFAWCVWDKASTPATPRTPLRHGRVSSLASSQPTVTSSPAADLLAGCHADTSLDWSREFVSVDRVEAFVRSVVLKLVPAQLWGSPDSGNRGHFFRLVRVLLRLRRKESLADHLYTHGAKVTSVEWLMGPKHGPNGRKVGKSPSLLQWATLAYRRWIVWLLNGLVIPLVATHFYVTETQFTGQRVVYYRKPVWRKFVQSSMGQLRRFVRAADEDEVALLRARRGWTGSRLRFVPKANGSARAIMLASRPLRGDKRSANDAARDAFRVLAGEQRRQPWLFGAAAFDIGQVYKRYAAFVEAWRAAGHPRLHWVSVDVAKSFDSVHQSTLWRCVVNLLKHPVYTLSSARAVRKRASSIRSTSIGTAVGHRMHETSAAAPAVGSASGVAMRQRRSPTNNNTGPNADATSVSPEGEARVPEGASLAVQAILSTQARNCIIMMDANSPQHRRSNILYALRELLRHHVVVYGPYTFVQHTGIPQGSVLSTLLCSLVYGHLEQTHLVAACDPPAWQGGAFVGPQPPSREQVVPKATRTTATAPERVEGTPVGEDANVADEAANNADVVHMRIRWVDDFLCVSSSADRASAFLATMQSAPVQEEYGVHINASKTHVNFHPASAPGANVSPMESEWMPWCGYLFHMQRLEVRVHWSRSWHVTDSLTVDQRHGAANRLAAKAKHFVDPMCQALVLDGAWNSVYNVRLNVYQLVRVCAMRVHTHVQALAGGGVHTNESFVAGIVDDVLQHVKGLIRRRMAQVGLPRRRCPVSDAEVKWLGIGAFVAALQPKQGLYACLVPHLRHQWAALGPDLSQSLTPVTLVDPNRNNNHIFATFKY